MSQTMGELSRMRTAKEKRDAAVGLLTHYVQMASQSRVNELDNDGRVEVGEIVDFIIEAAVLEMQVRAAARGSYR